MQSHQILEIPHCQQCSDKTCGASIPIIVEEKFVEFAGDKPKWLPMKLYWEALFMVWCRAWKSAIEWRDGKG